MFLLLGKSAFWIPERLGLWTPSQQYTSLLLSFLQAQAPLGYSNATYRTFLLCPRCASVIFLLCRAFHRATKELWFQRLAPYELSLLKFETPNQTKAVFLYTYSHQFISKHLISFKLFSAFYNIFFHFAILDDFVIFDRIVIHFACLLHTFQKTNNEIYRCVEEIEYQDHDVISLCAKNNEQVRWIWYPIYLLKFSV